MSGEVHRKLGARMMMLLRYGAKNFYSFKEGVEVSLELGAACPEGISKGKSVSCLLCFKGANGSGKTNALKIISFLSDFACSSFRKDPDSDIIISSYFSSSEPIDLFCEFEVNDVRYRYELSLTAKGVVSETLYRKLKRYRKVLERVGDSIEHSTEYYNGMYKIKLRHNASMISTARQYDLGGLGDVFTFFNSILTNVTSFGRTGLGGDYRKTTRLYKENDSMFDFAKKFLKECDLGIKDIEINSSKDEGGTEYFFPIFLHDCDMTSNWLVYGEQSLGTKTLFGIMPYLYYTLIRGGVLVMDEFDNDLHPFILQNIIKHFDNSSFNKRCAQLLFSTHNTEIIDVMGKYRIFIVNKEHCESFGYRLDEVSGELIRNDRSIATIYNTGRIGGVPRI